MKTLALFLLAAPAFANPTILEFRGSVEQFRTTLKSYVEQTYGVKCGKSGDRFYAVWIPEINKNFRTHVSCESDALHVRAVAKLKLMDCQSSEDPNCFHDVSVRSISITTKETLKK